MKIVHIESGLGNQMLSFCEYIALKMMNPEDDVYVETVIYDIPECNDIICQWNGYELNRIFGINAPNIRERFDEKKWEKFMGEIRSSEFWKRNWNYPVWVTKAFNDCGFPVKNIRGDFEEPNFLARYSGRKTLRSKIVDTKLGDTLKRLMYHIQEKKKLQEVDNRENIFLNANQDNVFTGQWLSFKYRNNDIERIDAAIRNTFIFPEFRDEKNNEMARFLGNCNSVAIHARRGDMLSFNGSCYKYGYFQRATNLIRKYVDNPVFVFFCDPGSVQWCKDNEKIFGLNFEKDQVYFVDWNKGEESYRDMQLISLCKHAIITNSSFGWWGAYLIGNKTKITVSPDITINTTHHC